MKLFFSFSTITLATCVSIFAYPGSAKAPILPTGNGKRQTRSIPTRKNSKPVTRRTTPSSKPKLPKRELTLVEKFLANPTETTARALIVGKHYLARGEGDIRINHKCFKSGQHSIFYQQDITSEAWGFVTISPTGQTRLFKGDRCLWGVQPGSPLQAHTLKLANSDTPTEVLSLKEVDGGSGGYEQSLRLFVPGNKGEWKAAGSVALSHAWRSPNFADLAGAEVPYENREVEIKFAGNKITVHGTEEIVRRLPDQPDSIQIERIKSTVVEKYTVHQHKIEKIARDSRVISRLNDEIPLRRAGSK